MKSLLIALHAVLALASSGEPSLRAPEISINDIRGWGVGERLGNLRAYHGYLEAYSQGVVTQFASILADPLAGRNAEILKQLYHSQGALLTVNEFWALLEDGTLQYSNELMAVIFEVASLGRLMQYFKPFSKLFHKETFYLSKSPGDTINSYLVASVGLLKDASRLSTWSQLLAHLVLMGEEVGERIHEIWEVAYFAARQLDLFVVTLHTNLDDLTIAASSVSSLAISSSHSSAVLLQGTSPLESSVILMELVSGPLTTALVWVSRIVKILPQPYARRFAVEVEGPATVTTRLITLNGLKILKMHEKMALSMADSQSLDPRLPFEADPDGFTTHVNDATLQVENAILLYHEMRHLTFPSGLLELVLSYKSHYLAGLFGEGLEVRIRSFAALVIDEWGSEGSWSRNSMTEIQSCLLRLKKAFLGEKPESQPTPARLAFEEALRELVLISSWSLYRSIDFGSPVPANSDDFATMQRDNLSVLCRVSRLLGTLQRSLALLEGSSRHYWERLLGLRPVLSSFLAAERQLARDLDVARRIAYPPTRNLILLNIQTNNWHIEVVLKVVYDFFERFGLEDDARSLQSSS